MAVKFNYGKSRNTANKLIDKFGAQGAILRYPNFFPEPVLMAVVDYNNRQIDGTRILQTDKQILISPIAPGGGSVTSPEPNQDRVQDVTGAVFEVINVNTLSPAGTAVLIEVQGRQ